MIALIRWNLWQRRLSIFWWSIAAFGLIFINMIFYPSFKDDAEQLQKSFEKIPKATLDFIGGSADFFSPVGFLNSQIYFLMLPLLLGVLAIGLGSSLLAKEEQDRTIEALLARPISRNKLLLVKSIVGIIIVAWVALISLLTTLITAKLVDLETSVGKIFLATLDCFLLVASFFAVAFVFTAFGRARGASMGIATTIALGGYIINSLSGTVEWLKTPAEILPFHYYDPEAVLRGTYDWSNSLYFAIVIATAALLSWMTFRRRDIH